MIGSLQILWGSFILALIFSGCANLSIEAWSSQRQECPDSDYDNGGSAPIIAGMCTSGTGALISYKGKL